uniref:Carboxypeptidase n=1 Tax=Prasinoderma singulare TaxID=676789 RepID=A0A7S3BDD8_9VIRI
MVRNPYAWTKLANLVAVESPVGVGYSYCDEMLHGGACANDDVRTAETLHAAMQDFVANKFPELAEAPFYISGESYAGVYCPTLAKAILDGNEDPTQTKINLAGLAVGDPCTDNDSQADSMDMLWYGHKNGFVLDEDFDILWNQCGMRYAHPLASGEWAVGEDGSVSAKGSSGANYAPVVTHRTVPRRGLLSGLSMPTNKAPSKQECDLAHRKFLLQTSKAFDQEWARGFINDLTLYGPSAIVGSSQKGSLNYRIAQWMMSDEVRAALHVQAAPQTAWPGPGAGWTYGSNYSACNADAHPGARSMVDFYRDIAPRVAGSVLVFNGDTDPCVSYEGTRDAIQNKVGFDLLEGGAWRPWFANWTAASRDFLDAKDLLFGPALTTQAAGPQLAGLTMDFDHGLSFATVHGSGHMVPQFRPRAAYRMMEGVLTGAPLAPLLPADAAIAAMSDAEWSDEMDKWTDVAKGASD